MKPSIANCKKCSKVFQKSLNEMCPECLRVDEENFTNLYRRLQKSAHVGGISIVELSEEMGLTVEEIDEIYMKGRLGTAAVLLKFECLTCGLLMTELQRKGRYCVNCSEKLASQAGVEVKSKTALEKEESDAQRREQQILMMKKNMAPSKSEPRRYGFVTRGDNS